MANISANQKSKKYSAKFNALVNLVASVIAHFTIVACAIVIFPLCFTLVQPRPLPLELKLVSAIFKHA